MYKFAALLLNMFAKCTNRCHLLNLLFCVLPLAASSYTITRFDQTLCASSFPTTYVTGSFSIIESSVGEFGKNQSNKTIIFSLPAGFQFNTTSGTYSVTGVSASDITSVTISAITATSITVRVTTASTAADINTITVTCQIRSSAAGSGIIFRSGGTFKINRSGAIPGTSESFGNLSAQLMMAYSSSTVAQVNNAIVPQGTVDNDIIQIQVVITGTCSPFNITQFNFTTSGSTNPSDITAARVYYTGTTNSFSPANLFGSFNSPSGSFVITGSQALSAGTHYFWLTYDISSTATISNVLDAQCNSMTMDGGIGSKVPTVQSPSGSRSISSLIQYYSRSSGNWNDNTNWSNTDGGIACNCQPNNSGNVFINTGHTITVDANRTTDFVTIKDGATLRDNGTNTLTVNLGLHSLASGRFTATSAWIVSGNLTLSGTGSSTTTKSFTVNGNTTIDNGTTLTENGSAGNDISLKGNITLDGTLSSGTSGGTIVLNGSSSQILNGTGIISGTGTITLSTSAKNIGSGTSITISPDITISGAITVTNNGTVTSNNINGTLASSTWTNAASSTLKVSGALMSTGTLTATASSNTVEYNKAGDQTIKGTTYANLTLSQSGIKTFSGSTTSVTNLLTMSGAAIAEVGANTLNGAGGLTMIGTSELRIAKTTASVPELTGVYSLSSGTITLNQTGAATQTPAAIAYYNLKLDGSNLSSNFDLSSVTDILGNLEVINKSNITGSGAISITGSLTHSTTGTSTLQNDMTVTGNSTFTGGTFITNGKYLTTGSIALSGSTLNNSTGTIELITGSWTNNSGIFTQGTGTVLFSGTSAQSITGTQTTTFGNLSISNATGVTIAMGPLSVTSALTINASGTLSAGTADIMLSGNFTNNGTYNSGTGTITFNGSGAQSITGSSASTFNNISVTNTTGVSVESNQNLRGILTLGANARFDADGANNTAVFKLLSSADSPSSDAAIGILPSTAQLTGNVTVQRYMAVEGPGSARIYRFVSSPVVNATVADIQNEIPVTGAFTGTSICLRCGISQSMFSYDETVTTDINLSGANDVSDGYTKFPNLVNTETLAMAKGYTLFVRGDVLTSALWDVRGTVRNGNASAVSFPVTWTSSGNNVHDGWNLVGNPFPSTIDWNASSGWTKTNIEGTIYIADNGGASAQYATWNGVTGTNGGSRYIAMGQAFWVKANAASPSLTANENIKAPGTQTTFFREMSLHNLLRVSMRKGTVRDETVIHFRDDASAGFDTHADARKFNNNSFNLSTLLEDGKNLAINSMSTLDCNATIPLSIQNASVGAYTLEFTEYETFPVSAKITLYDSYTDKSFDVSTGSYEFSVTADPRTYGSERFSITFKTTEVRNEFTATTNAICEGADASVEIRQSQEGARYSAMLEGKAIGNLIVGNGGTARIHIPADQLKAGVNIIAVHAAMPYCASSIAERSIALTVEKKYEVAEVQHGKICSGGVVTLTASGAPENGYYNWYDTKTSKEPLTHQQSPLFTTSVGNKTKTYYVSIVNGLGCEGERIPVIAEVVHIEAAQILHTGNVLKSNYEEGNQWYFNSEIIPGQTQQFLTPEKSGTYEVLVNANGCTSSATYEVMSMDNEPGDVTGTVSVYPNPAKDHIYIESSNTSSRADSYELINISGNVVGEITTQEENGKAIGEYDVSELPSGIYLLRNSETLSIDAKILKD